MLRQSNSYLHTIHGRMKLTEKMYISLMEEIENSPSSYIPQIFNLPLPGHHRFKSPLHFDVHYSICSWLKFTNILLDKYKGFLQSVTP